MKLIKSISILCSRNEFLLNSFFDGCRFCIKKCQKQRSCYLPSADPSLTWRLLLRVRRTSVYCDAKRQSEVYTVSHLAPVCKVDFVLALTNQHQIWNDPRQGVKEKHCPIRDENRLVRSPLQKHAIFTGVKYRSCSWYFLTFQDYQCELVVMRKLLKMNTVQTLKNPDESKGTSFSKRDQTFIYKSVLHVAY